MKKVRQVVLDTETTGLDAARGHRVIEIGCVEVVNRRITSEQFHEFLQPDRKIDEGAQKVHGISNESLVNKPRFKDIVDEFLAFVSGCEVIIHNAPFDVGFLNSELKRCGRGEIKLEDICQITDTLVMARQRYPGQRNTLDALCKRYEIDNTQRTLHGALLDASILAEVYLAMTRQQDSLFTLERVPVVEMPLEAVDRPQRTSERPPLRVLQATTEEMAAHQDYVEWLDKKSGGSCMWKRLY